MRNLDLATILTMLGLAFAGGVTLTTLNNRLDRLDEKVTEFKESQAEPLCLTVLTTQVKAVESGKKSAMDELKKLSDRFCPQPPSNTLNASLAVETDAAEKLKQIQEANEDLARIVQEMDKPL